MFCLMTVFFFVEVFDFKKAPKKQIQKVWRGNVGFNKGSWCIIYCSPGGKMKNKNQKNIPSYITCAFAATHTITFSRRTPSKFRRFTCKLLWKVPTVGDECFYKTIIMSLHINNSSTRPVCPVLCSWAFFFLFHLEICTFIEWHGLPGKRVFSGISNVRFIFGIFTVYRRNLSFCWTCCLLPVPAADIICHYMFNSGVPTWHVTPVGHGLYMLTL